MHARLPADQNVDTQASHVHLGTCVPHNQTLSGTVVLDVLLQLHDLSDRRITAVRAFVKHPSGNIELGRVSGLDMRCTEPTCALAVRLTVNTTRVPYDGLTMLRVRTVEEYIVAPPPNLDLRFNTNLDMWVVLKNGKTEQSTKSFASPTRAFGFASFPVSSSLYFTIRRRAALCRWQAALCCRDSTVY